MAAKDKDKKPSMQREKLAGFLYDIAKLVFGGLVIGTLTPLVTKDYANVSVGILISGGVTTLVLAMWANRLLKI